MRRLAEVPVFGVVVVCITWILLTIFVPLLWMIIQMRRQVAILERSGSGGEGVVTYVDGWVMLLPPLVFCMVWFIARRRARAVPLREG